MAIDEKDGPEEGPPLAELFDLSVTAEDGEIVDIAFPPAEETPDETS